jgi:predicted DNA-binding transcriptional regulator AlpA
MALRKALRLSSVMEATGYSRSSIYQKINDQKFPPGHKLDPNGSARVWFDDEIEQVQAGTWRPSTMES